MEGERDVAIYALMDTSKATSLTINNRIDKITMERAKQQKFYWRRQQPGMPPVGSQPLPVPPGAALGAAGGAGAAGSSPPRTPAPRARSGRGLRLVGAGTTWPGPPPSRCQPLLPPREKRLSWRGVQGAPPPPAAQPWPAGERRFRAERSAQPTAHRLRCRPCTRTARGAERPPPPPRSPPAAPCGEPGPRRPQPPAPHMRPPPPRAASAQRAEHGPAPPSTPRHGAPGGRARCPVPRATCRQVSRELFFQERLGAAGARGRRQRRGSRGHRPVPGAEPGRGRAGGFPWDGGHTPGEMRMAGRGWRVVRVRARVVATGFSPAAGMEERDCPPVPSSVRGPGLPVLPAAGGARLAERTARLGPGARLSCRGGGSRRARLIQRARFVMLGLPLAGFPSPRVRCLPRAARRRVFHIYSLPNLKVLYSFNLKNN